MNEYVVLGDPPTCELIRQACQKHQLSTLQPGNELEVQDEFDCRRWFSRNTPQGTFYCLGMGAQLSVNNWMFNVAGPLNVIRAALGNSKRLILAAHFPSNEFFLFSQLLHLLRVEKKVDFYVLTGNPKESLEAFAERCVLSMRDVSPPQTNQEGSKGPQQRREVLDQVLPESQSCKQHRSDAQPLLEVPVATAQRAAPGDVRAQCPAPEGKEAQNPDFNHPGSIPGVVQTDRVS